MAANVTDAAAIEVQRTVVQLIVGNPQV